MRRPFLVALLALGTALGFGSGISHMRWRGYERRAEFERHVADICVNAARDAESRTAVSAAPVSAPAQATATPAPSATPATVSPTTIYVVPSFVPGYPYGQPFVGAPAPVAPAQIQATPAPAVPAAKP